MIEWQMAIKQTGKYSLNSCSQKGELYMALHLFVYCRCYMIEHDAIDDEWAIR